MNFSFASFCKISLKVIEQILSCKHVTKTVCKFWNFQWKFLKHHQLKTVLVEGFNHLLFCFSIWKKHSNIQIIQKVWRKSQVNFNIVVKDILQVNFTKFLLLECWQMKTAFQTKFQCIFWECKHSTWTISQLILKRLQCDIPVYSSYTCPKYWGFE